MALKCCGFQVYFSAKPLPLCLPLPRTTIIFRPELHYDNGLHILPFDLGSETCSCTRHGTWHTPGLLELHSMRQACWKFTACARTAGSSQHVPLMLPLALCNAGLTLSDLPLASLLVTDSQTAEPSINSCL